MRYRLHSGVGEIVCETADQMAALVLALKSNGAGARRSTSTVASSSHSGITGGTGESAPSLSTVLAALQKSTRRYVELLVENPDGTLDSKLFPLLKLKRQGNVSAVIVSLDNALKKAGLRYGDVFSRSKHFNGGGRDHLQAIRPEVLEEVKKSIRTQ